MDQNYPYYGKHCNNDRMYIISCKQISKDMTVLEYKSQRLKQWLDQMFSLTCNHLMLMLLYTQGQPQAFHCPKQTAVYGPCNLSSLVCLPTPFFNIFIVLFSFILRRKISLEKWFIWTLLLYVSLVLVLLSLYIFLWFLFFSWLL